MSERKRKRSSGLLVRHLDRAELGLRDAQVLRLAAGHRAVELGVAEQRGALALSARTCVVSHWANRPRLHIQQGPQEMLNGMTTRSPGLDVGDLGADLLDDAHRLVAEDVTGREERAEHLVEVQVGAADRGRGDLDDGVGRLLDRGSGTSSTRTSRLPCQVSAFMPWNLQG